MPEYGIQAKKVLWYQDDIWNLLALPFSLLFLFFSFLFQSRASEGMVFDLKWAIRSQKKPL
jgi:hypothetical protein